MVAAVGSVVSFPREECSARSCRQGLHVIQRKRADSGLGPVDTAENPQCGASTSQQGEEDKAVVCGIPLAASGSPFCSHGLGREQGDSGPCFTSLALQGAGSYAEEILGTCGLWPGHTPTQSRSCLYCSITALPRLGVTVPHCHAGE